MALVPYEFDSERFSRWMAYVLRHNPTRYGLQADAHGFVDVDAFVQIARRRYPQASEETLRQLIGAASGRFELVENRLRARYGHSIPVQPASQPVPPPAFLYCGIDAMRLPAVLAEGLKPLDRQMLHLSDQVQDAWAMIRRKTPYPAVVRIDAARAHSEGVRFYLEQKVYLAASIPAAYLAKEAEPSITPA